MSRLWGRGGLALAAVCAIGLVLMPGTARAATIDGDHCTQTDLQAAIYANVGGTITFSASCTIELTTPLDLSAGHVTIDGSGFTVILDGQGITRIFDDFGGASSSYTLSHLTLEHGYVGGGGNGGAISFTASGADLTLSHDTFIDNEVGPTEGGGAVDAKALTITDSTFSGNSAGYGGKGGAVYIEDSGGLFAADDTFSGNSVGQYGEGGAVFIGSSALGTIGTSTLSGNSTGAGGYGGAIATLGQTDVSLSTLSGNSVGATGFGNAIADLNVTDTDNLEFSTIAGNTGGGASALYDANAGFVIDYSLFSGNGTDCGGPGSGGFSDGTYNFTDTDGSSCNFTDASTTVSTDAHLAPLGDYGGPTQTMALQATSPAVVRNGGANCGNSTDQRGFPQDSMNCSIGAYAYDAANQYIGTCDETTLDAAVAAASSTTIKYGQDCTTDITSTMAFTSADPATVTIDANGHSVTLDGQDATQIFHFGPGAGNLTLDGLRLVHGFFPNGGGAIWFESGGTLTVNDSTFEDNAGDNSGGHGGAINNGDGDATISDSTFTSNAANYGGAYSGGGTFTGDAFDQNSAYQQGGAVFGAGSFTNSTFSGNSASGTGGGGAIVAYNGGVSLLNDTLVGNTGGAAVDAFAFGIVPGSIDAIGWTIFSGNDGDCSTPVTTDDGFNLTDTDGLSCGFSSSAPYDDTLSTDAHLGSLQNNGGPTDTYALTELSPPFATNTHNDCGLSTDQRGVTRPGSRCSIGAYQYDPTSQTISTCDEATVHNAVEIAANADAAATVDFNGDCTVQLTSEMTFGTGAHVTIDGSGHSVVFDGQGSTRIFDFGGSSGSLTLKGLTLENGSAAYGGAIVFTSSGTLLVEDSTFLDNSAGFDGAGGAIDATNLIVQRSTFTGNSGGIGGTGGAVYVNGGSGAFGDDTFSSNSVGSGGDGGALMDQSGNVQVTSSTFEGNSAGVGGRGGAFDAAGATDAIRNSTFSGNSLGSGVKGSAIASESFTTLRNDTIVGNTGAPAVWTLDFETTNTGWTLFSGNAGDCSGAGSVADDGYNLTDGDGTDCGFSGGSNDTVSTAANLGSFGINGGLTETYPLTTASPAAAVDSHADCGLPTDQRGASRPVGRCSVGSFQYDPTTQLVTTCDTANVTGALEGAAAEGQPATVKFDSDCTATTGSTIDVPDGSDVTVSGNGHTVALSGGDDHRLFSVGNATLTLKGLTLEHAQDLSNPGAAVDTHDNNAVVTILNTTVRDSASADGMLTGGGAWTVTNSTFANNSSTSGGVVFDGSFGTGTFSAVTMVGNDGPGVFSVGFETFNLKDTLIAANGVSVACTDLFATTVNESYNLFDSSGDGGSSCGIADGVNNDVVTSDAHLMPLGNYGGHEDTVALENTSPAIDAGSCTDYFGATLHFDQRGVARPRDATCDIGAYEALDGPVTTFHITPASPNGSNGWYKLAPHVTLGAGAVHGANSTTYYDVIDAPVGCSPETPGGCTTYSGTFALPDGQDTVTYFSSTDTPTFESANFSGLYKVDTHAPTTSIDLNGYTAGKWTNADVQFALNPTDATSGVATTSYTLDGSTTGYSSPVTVSDEGSHLLKYWSGDVAGNSENPHAVAIKIDKTAPMLSGAPTTSPNGNGWYHTNVTIHWSCSDPVSGGVASGIASCPVNSTITSQGTGLTVNAQDKDNAGNTTPATSSPSVQIDKTAPTTAGALSTSGFHSGTTYEGPVTLTLTPSDALSGVQSTYYTVDGGSAQTYSTPVSFDTVGSHTLTWWSTDVADNAETHHTLTFLLVHTPDAPPLGTVTQGVRSLGVSWTAPADTGSPLTYLVTYVNQTTSASVTKSVPAPATSTTLTGLANGTSYSVSVAAKNVAGTGPSSSATLQSTYGLPAAPTSFVATRGDSSASLTWQPSVSDGGTPITSYALTITSSGGTTSQGFDPGTACTISGCSANLTGLTNGTNYSLKLTAVNAAGSSAAVLASVKPLAVPGTPTNVNPTGGVKNVSVTWKAPTNTGGGIASYTLTVTGGASPIVKSVTPAVACGGDPCATTVTGLANGTVYHVTVKAVNAAGSSPASTSMLFVTYDVPSAPNSFVATPGTGSADLSWNAPSIVGGTPVTGYRLRVYVGSSLTNTITVSCTTASCNYTLGSLTTGTTYTLYLNAVNAVGNGPNAITTVKPH